MPTGYQTMARPVNVTAFPDSILGRWIPYANVINVHIWIFAKIVI